MTRPAFALALALASIANVVCVLGGAGCSYKPGPARGCATLADGGASVSDGGPCIAPPTAAATRAQCDGITSYCDAHGQLAPALNCLTSTPPSHPPAPARVTLTGFVRALESGGDTSDLTVQVIDPAILANGANPAFVQSIGAHTTTLDGSLACSDKMACLTAGPTCTAGHCWTKSAGTEPLQRACDADIKLGCVFALADGCNHSCNDGLYGRPDNGKYCRDDGSGGTCRDRLRWEPRYTIDNVPTNRALVTRLAGPGGVANANWVQVIRWGLFFASDARACNGDGDDDCLDLADAAHPAYRLDLHAVAQSDWTRLAVTSGLEGGVPNGDGAVFGEVHDCDDVRVAHVGVAVSPAAARVGYFTADPLTLVPDVTRAASGTDPLGRFAAWGLRAGRVIVGSAGLSGGQVASFGRSDIFVYAGTLSVVTLGGGKR